MINAGNAIDVVIEQLLPFLEPGDVIMDGGNSHYLDTERRINNLKEQGIHLLGVGVSGGEEGALNGPAIMPGGSSEAYAAVGNILESIAAKDVTGKACCAYLGKGGSGHFVKMVHNGIEYSEMQLLAEVFQILRQGLNLQNSVIADVLKSWQKTEADSYLLGITIDILQRKVNNDYLLDEVLDKAGNKGTGNWTTVAASQLGVPVSVLTSALYARYISAFKELRAEASKVYVSNDNSAIEIDQETIRKGYQLARLVNHHQGIHLLSEASQAYRWDLNLGEIARIWTNGCIIRSKLMEKLKSYLKHNNQLLLNDEVIKFVNNSKGNLKELVQKAIQNDVPVSCLSESLNYLNAFSQKESGANLIQAQRDYFGAHLYQRKNDPSGNWYHTDWDPGKNS
jgi:6-phosphogluconate dehydrogenase